MKGDANPLPKQRRASKGTVDFAFRVIRRLFVTNGVDWPFRRGEGPQVRVRDQDQFGLDPLAIKKAVIAALEGNLEPRDAAFLALATTYGLRLGEIAHKGDPERHHLVPEEIVPVLERYSFGERVTSSAMNWSWLKVERAAGLPRIKKEATTRSDGA